ncbi:hypothetical protein MRX96_045381 [Rhipicephalus microplus]
MESEVGRPRRRSFRKQWLSFRPPEPLRLGENVADNWLKFKQRIQLYFAATEQHKPRTKAQKVDIFLHLARQEAIDVFSTMSISEEDKVDYDKLVETYEAYCLSQTNKTYERVPSRSSETPLLVPAENSETSVRVTGERCDTTGGPPSEHNGSNDSSNAFGRASVSGRAGCPRPFKPHGPQVNQAEPTALPSELR